MTEWDAAAYAEISGLQKAMAAESLALLNVTGSERILDLGCGNGTITAQIAERVKSGSVVGVDASQDMISFASQKGNHAKQPNLSYRVADARRLQFHGEFDIVVSFNALHWVPEQAEALRGIRAALKNNGLAQLRFVYDGGRRSLEDVLEDTRTSERWARYFADFKRPYLHLTPEDYKKLAEGCGFEVRAMDTKDKAWDFKSRQAFAAFGHVTFVEWTRFLPENDWPAFISDVLDRYRQVAAMRAGEENTFKFYQMDIQLLCK
jgi:trans-aconitate 2-methyltransferase